jgi:hypothetical protein
MISGRSVVGARLGVSVNIWPGTRRRSFRYEWELCSKRSIAIAHATHRTYTLTKKDVGRWIRVVVIGESSTGTLHVLSSRVGPVI